jgi:hypothetical protein
MTRSKIIAGISALGITGSAAFMALSGPAQADTAGWQRVQTLATVDAGSGVEVVEAECPSGKKVTGGGWSEGDNDLSTRIDVVEDQPFSAGGGWSVHFVRHASVDREVGVFAVCINET